MAGEDENLEIVPERAVEVRETRTLFRLAPAADNDLGRSSRQIAIVAADTEEEARQIACMHDAFGRDWDQLFTLWIDEIHSVTLGADQLSQHFLDTPGDAARGKARVQLIGGHE